MERNSHLSDDVAAFALARNAAVRQAPPAAGEGVRMVEEETNPYVIT